MRSSRKLRELIYEIRAPVLVHTTRSTISARNRACNASPVPHMSCGDDRGSSCWGHVTKVDQPIRCRPEARVFNPRHQ